MTPVLHGLRQGVQSGAGAAPLPGGSEAARRHGPATRNAKASREPSALKSGIRQGSRLAPRPQSLPANVLERAAGGCGPSVAAGCLGLADPGGDGDALVAGDAEREALRRERLLDLARGRALGGTSRGPGWSQGQAGAVGQAASRAGACCARRKARRRIFCAKGQHSSCATKRHVPSPTLGACSRRASMSPATSSGWTTAMTLH